MRLAQKKIHPSLMATACLLFAGCAGELSSVTSGQIGCPQEEIAVYDHNIRWGSASWTAECRGKTYYCAGVTGSISCKDQAAGGEVLADTTAQHSTDTASSDSASQMATAPAAPATNNGCAYDTQCKGARICVMGACAEPAQTYTKKPALSRAEPPAAQSAR